MLAAVGILTLLAVVVNKSRLCFADTYDINALCDIYGCKIFALCNINRCIVCCCIKSILNEEECIFAFFGCKTYK